jgi:hypothetical protein
VATQFAEGTAIIRNLANLRGDGELTGGSSDTAKTVSFERFLSHFGSSRGLLFSTLVGPRKDEETQGGDSEEIAVIPSTILYIAYLHCRLSF